MNKYIKGRYLNQFASEIIDSWQQDSTRCALQYVIMNCVTMATYWVQELPNVRAFTGFFWRSILIHFSDALFVRCSKHINVFKVDYLSWCNFSGLKFTTILKTTGRTGKESIAIIISVSVSPLELWVYQVSMVSIIQCLIG